MSYVVLARKYRPMTFSDLVGQGHVATTLSNAIAQNRVAHAFLFTGVRGVGKTTSARILAKALNCSSSNGPTATPCLECSACREITAGTDVDVQEIDGASYNGVDEVRRLQESLPYRPARDRFKIFIVDEVHMLSQSAWNAFLKTLEEPPPHVKFIFATTEVHKVPITILSRVQRFDFKLIPSRAIVERLRSVLVAEKIDADDEALAILARQAAGSMRDAMSLLDQVIAWSDGRLTGESVATVLGVASRRILYDLAQALAQCDAAQLLLTIDALANQGFDLGHVARDFLALLRDIIVAAHGDAAAAALDLPADEVADVVRLAQHATDDWLRLYQAFSRGYDDVVRSSAPRAALEMLLVRLARRPAAVPLDDLMGRLIRLEKRLAGARPPDGGAGGRGRPAGGSPSAPSSGGPAAANPARGGARFDAPKDTAAEPALSRPNEAPQQRPAEARAPQTDAAPPRNAPSSAPSSAPVPPSVVPRQAPPSRAEPAPQTSPQARPPASAPAHAAEARASTSNWQDLSDVERWRRVVDGLRPSDARLGAFLDHARVHCITPQLVHVSFEPNSVFEATLADKSTQATLLATATRLFGATPELSLEPKAADGATTVFEIDRKARLEREQELMDRARQHPAVQEAIRVLGARVKQIELPEN